MMMRAKLSSIFTVMAVGYLLIVQLSKAIFCCPSFGGMDILGSQDTHVKSRRVFVCITGQVQRLALPKQMESMLLPLMESGYHVDVALVLSDGEVRFTNRRSEEDAVRFPTFRSALEYLHWQQRNNSLVNSSLTILTHQPTPALDFKEPKNRNLTVRSDYIARLDKVYRSALWQRNRAENHARQFSNLNQCNKYYRLTSSSEGTQSYYKYDFVLRVREDVAMLENWNATGIQNLESKLLESRNYRRTVYSNDCRCHRGINDRLALVTPDVAPLYFTRPLEMIFANTPLHRKVSNPETFAYYNYQEFAKVVTTRLLRTVVKYTYSPEPNTTRTNANRTNTYTDGYSEFALAVGEQLPKCPRTLWEAIKYRTGLYYGRTKRRLLRSLFGYDSEYDDSE